MRGKWADMSIPANVYVIVAVAIGIVVLLLWDIIKIFAKALVVGIVAYAAVLLLVVWLTGGLPDFTTLVAVLAVVEAASIVIGFLKTHNV
jgi:hypothetical protein